jgi:hypothetical protein
MFNIRIVEASKLAKKKDGQRLRSEAKILKLCQKPRHDH